MKTQTFLTRKEDLMKTLKMILITALIFPLAAKAAPGLSELPKEGTQLPSLATDDPRLGEVMAAYETTVEKKGEVTINGSKTRFTAHFLLGGRYGDPDANVRTNLLIVTTESDLGPFIFLLGPVDVASIKQVSNSRFVIKGSGGSAYGGGQPCLFNGLTRELVVDVLGNSGDKQAPDIQAKYVKTQDTQWCTKQ